MNKVNLTITIKMGSDDGHATYFTISGDHGPAAGLVMKCFTRAQVDASMQHLIYADSHVRPMLTREPAIEAQKADCRYCTATVELV